MRPYGELIEEADCFKYSGSQVAADGECERDVVQKMNERHKAWGALEYMPSNRGLVRNANRCLYEGVQAET